MTTATTNRRPSSSVWVWAGAGAQVVFTAYWLLAPLWQGPRYSVVAHSISDMYAVTAPYGAVMVAVLTLCGAATIAFALLGLLPQLRRAGRTGWAACLLLALSIFGLGDLLTPFERLVCRLADPGCRPSAQLANAGGTLDATLSTIGILLLVVAGGFCYAASRRITAWQPMSVPILVLSVVLVIGFGAAGFGPLAVAGLSERLVALAGATMITVLAVRVARNPAMGD